MGVRVERSRLACVMPESLYEARLDEIARRIEANEEQVAQLVACGAREEDAGEFVITSRNIFGKPLPGDEWLDKDIPPKHEETEDEDELYE